MNIIVNLWLLLVLGVNIFLFGVMAANCFKNSEQENKQLRDTIEEVIELLDDEPARNILTRVVRKMR